jgi:hypothetical protein
MTGALESIDELLPDQIPPLDRGEARMTTPPDLRAECLAVLQYRFGT